MKDKEGTIDPFIVPAEIKAEKTMGILKLNLPPLLPPAPAAEGDPLLGLPPPAGADGTPANATPEDDDFENFKNEDADDAIEIAEAGAGAVVPSGEEEDASDDRADSRGRGGAADEDEEETDGDDATDAPRFAPKPKGTGKFPSFMMSGAPKNKNNNEKNNKDEIKKNNKDKNKNGHVASLEKLLALDEEGIVLSSSAMDSEALGNLMLASPPAGEEEAAAEAAAAEAAAGEGGAARAESPEGDGASDVPAPDEGGVVLASSKIDSSALRNIMLTSLLEGEEQAAAVEAAAEAAGEGEGVGGESSEKSGAPDEAPSDGANGIASAEAPDEGVEATGGEPPEAAATVAPEEEVGITAEKEGTEAEDAESEFDSGCADSGRWHLNVENGKCNNAPTEEDQPYVFDTAEECCAKFFETEGCKDDFVEDVCASGGDGDVEPVEAETEPAEAVSAAPEIKDVTEAEDAGSEFRPGCVNSGRWHLSPANGKCHNYLMKELPFFNYDTAEECCAKFFETEGCEEDNVEDVCATAEDVNAELAEEAEGGMGNATATSMEGAQIKAVIHPGCTKSGRWHLDLENGKCNNARMEEEPAFAFDTPEECCAKFLSPDGCEDGWVEDVCATVYDGNAELAETGPAEAVAIEPVEDVVLAEKGGIPEEEGGAAEGGETPCVSVRWHQNPENGKCSNAPEHGAPSLETFAFDTPEECCVKFLSPDGCEDGWVEDVCATASGGDAEPAEEVEDATEDGTPMTPKSGIPEEEAGVAAEGASGAEGGEAPCVTVGWHQNPENGKCSNSPEHGTPSFETETLEDCCVKILNRYECGEDLLKDDLVEDVCANAADKAGDADAKPAETGPAEAAETEPAEEAILAEEGGIPEEEGGEAVDRADGSEGGETPCVTVGWHKNPANGKCSNSPDPEHGTPPFTTDTVQACCFKILNKWECSEDLVEDVCADAGDGAGAVKGGAAVLAEEAAQEGEGAAEDAAEEAEEGAATEGETVENEEDDVGDINDGDASLAALLEVTEGEGDEEEVEEAEEGDPAADSSTTEGQGFELDDESTKPNWEGFEKEESPKIAQPEDEGKSNTKSHDVSELNDASGYEGDGFRFHVLRPKVGGGSSVMSDISGLVASPVGAGAALLASLLLCYCCVRCRKRRQFHKRRVPNRANYAVLGSDDFFNGTFSDDISFGGKDSDEEASDNDSDDEDYRDGMVKLEMGGIHELDANGGLTLSEVNG